jgi:hypothetical protein
MKKMIVDKNNQLKAVRERLSKYENLDDDWKIKNEKQGANKRCSFYF